MRAEYLILGAVAILLYLGIYTQLNKTGKEKAEQLRPDNFQVQLVAIEEAEQDYELNDCFCNRRKKVQTGSYALLIDGKQHPIGSFQFCENKEITHLNLGYYDLFVVYQFATCNSREARIFEYDWIAKRLSPIRFERANGVQQNNLNTFTEVGQTKSGYLTSTTYDPSDEDGFPITIKYWKFDHYARSFTLEKITKQHEIP